MVVFILIILYGIDDAITAFEESFVIKDVFGVINGQLVMFSN